MPMLPVAVVAKRELGFLAQLLHTELLHSGSAAAASSFSDFSMFLSPALDFVTHVAAAR